MSQKNKLSTLNHKIKTGKKPVEVKINQAAPEQSKSEKAYPKEAPSQIKKGRKGRPKKIE